jgi:hypothetical protein
MKKHLIAAVAALCVFGATDMMAQRGGGHRFNGNRHHSRYYESGVTLSVGYLHSNYKHKEWENERRSKDQGLNGINVGVTKDFSIIRNTLYFQTGLSYQWQTSSNRIKDELGTQVWKRNEHYLDIPLRFKFTIDVMPEIRAFVYVGPTLDFGLSSTLKGRAKVADSEVISYKYNYFTGKPENIEYPTPASPYRAFDIFMGGAIGAEIYDIVEVKLGFDWGLINKNRSKEVADYMVTHRNLFHLGIGVKF